MAEVGRAEGGLGERIDAAVVNHQKGLGWLAVAKVAGVAQLAHAPERGQPMAGGGLSASARAR